MEDVAAGQAQVAVQVQRGLRLDARPSIHVSRQAVGDRLREMGVQLGKGRLQQFVAYGLVVLFEEPGRGVQAEQGEGLVALGDEVGAEDRRVGQRVAVDLGRRRGGEFPGGGLGVGGGQLVVALGDVEGAGECLAGVDGAVAQPGQAPEQHVHLELGALGGGRGCLAGEVGQFPGGGVDQDVPGGGDAFAVSRAVGDLGGTAVRVDPYRLMPGDEDRARLACRRGQGVGEGAHAADGDVPGAGAAADHVVEEAAVLLERRVVRVGERADQGVRQDHAPHEVVGETVLDRDPDRLLEEGPPGLLVVHPAAQFPAARQRLGERREHPLGDLAGHVVEALPGRVLTLGAGQPGERLAGTPFTAAHQQSGRASVPFHGGVGGDVAGADPEVQAEVPDDLLRQQADQVRVAGEPGVDAGERSRGHGGAPRYKRQLQHQHGPAGPRQVGGGDQAVVASADDDGVVRTACGASLVCRHGSS